MDLRKLEHAALLAETLNFARAAERAHLTQSALSRSIQALEHALGLRLFDRQHGGLGGVTPTAAGRQLLERARPLLRAADDLDRDMALLRGAALGELPIGAGPFPAATLLPAALAGLGQSHPALRVSLQIDHTAALCELLAADRIELFVADSRDAEKRDDLVVRRLATQQGGMFCRAAHPLARRRKLVVAELAGQRFASVHLPAAVRDNLLRMMRPAGEASWALTCDNVYLLKDLGRRSDVLLLCTEESLADELASGEFVKLPVIDLRPMPVAVSLFTRAGRTLSPAAALLAARLADEAKRGR